MDNTTKRFWSPCFSKTLKFKTMSQNRRKFLSRMAAMGMTPLIPDVVQTIHKEKKIDVKNYKAINKVGFNLLLWSAVVSDKMNPIAERLKQIGYDGIEVATAELKSEPYVALG